LVCPVIYNTSNGGAAEGEKSIPPDPLREISVVTD